VTTPKDRLTQNYTPAFLTFLNHPDEEALHSAYALGRAALSDNITLLDLVRTHHQVFGEILRTTTNPDDLTAIVNAAADFLVEALAPFEIARRGFLETTASPTPSNRPTNPTPDA
jgi:hypothetical protein